MNVAAGLPVVDPPAVQEATEKLAAHRARAGLGATEGASATPRPQMRLVRVERPKPVSETAVPAPTPSPTPLPEDAPVAPAIAVKAPQSTPAAAATARSTPTAVAVATPVAKPRNSSAPALHFAESGIHYNDGGRKWPTYPPGQMPRGRLANVPDMSELASRGVGGERVYLQGSFVVTASGQDRAVLRSQAALPENLGIGGGRTGNTRIIVEFPSGSRPPSEGSTLSRDARRPFLVTEVRKTSDGQVNVYVREVTRAQ